MSVSVCECVHMVAHSCTCNDCAYTREQAQPWVIIAQLLYSFVFDFLFIWAFLAWWLLFSRQGLSLAWMDVHEALHSWQWDYKLMTCGTFM